MNITFEQKPESTAVISYRFDGYDLNDFRNIYTDYPIRSTDALRFIQAAAQEFILDLEGREEIYRASLFILKSDFPSILIPGWSYWFTVIDLDEEDEEEGDEEPEEDEEEEEGEE